MATITRTWKRDLVTRGFAEFSKCERYRYRLEVRWGQGRALGFTMLNPSTANEQKNDPTVERCEKRARVLGYPAVIITNLFAWRATDPKAMQKVDEPIGFYNDAAIVQAFAESELTVAAWGRDGLYRDRAKYVCQTLLNGLPLYCLKQTNGVPHHPLYLAYSLKPVLFDPNLK